MKAIAMFTTSLGAGRENSSCARSFAATAPPKPSMVVLEAFSLVRIRALEPHNPLCDDELIADR
jgi:hypothetical protein